MTYSLRTATVTALLLAASACGPLPAPESRARPIVSAGAQPDSAVFITRLGSDTLVVERMVRTGNRIEAEVLMRTPSTVRDRWVMELAPTGQMQRLERTPLDPATGAPRQAVPQQSYERAGTDSLHVRLRTQEGTRTSTVAAPAATLPFIDMVHWPYEVALMRARATNLGTVEQPLLTGSRTSMFAIERIGSDSMTITHPSRGTMRVRVDATGRLLGLDAGATTRKLVVERRPWMQIDDLARRWSAADAAGRAAGALSGRDTARAIIQGATMMVDYGTPWRRGRTIWGTLVPYGEVWRTGANMATHFTTSRPLRLGSGADTLHVPAGSYTFFSIPVSGGGTFIVSRQTGQSGTAYDRSRDLGRVRMEARPLSTPVERFTIALGDDDGSGAIRLQWADTEMVVPFVVR